MQMVGPAYMDYALNGRSGGPRGNRHPTGAAAPHGVFPCAGDDRWIAIAVGSDAEWAALAEAMGSPAWACEPALASVAGRVQAIDRIHAEIAAWTRGHDDRSLATRLQAAGVAATPVLAVADLLDDPHYRARGTFIEVRHPLGFDETLYGGYVKMSRTPAVVRPGPVMGQDNDRAFLDILKLPAEEYQRLKESQVIY